MMKQNGASPFPGVVPVGIWSQGHLVNLGTGVLSSTGNLVAVAASLLVDYDIDDPKGGAHPVPLMGLDLSKAVLIVGVPRDGGRSSAWVWAAESLTCQRLLRRKPGASFLHMPHVDVLELSHSFKPVPVGAHEFDLDDVMPLPAAAETGAVVAAGATGSGGYGVSPLMPHYQPRHHTSSLRQHCGAALLHHQPEIVAASHAGLGQQDVLRLVGFPLDGGGALSTTLCRLETMSVPNGLAVARLCAPFCAPGAAVVDAHGRHVGVVAREREDASFGSGSGGGGGGGLVDIALFSSADVSVLAGESTITIHEPHLEPQEHAHLVRLSSAHRMGGAICHSGFSGSGILHV